MTSQTIMQGVRQILKDNPKARNSYNWLWYLYCRDIAQIKIYVEFEALDGKKSLPSVESIGRAARKIQNEEQVYKPAFETQKARQDNELKVRDWAIKKSSSLIVASPYSGWGGSAKW